MVVDLRNTAIPFFISPKIHTPFAKITAAKNHKKVNHLNRLKSICDVPSESKQRFSIHIPKDDTQYIEDIFRQELNGQGRIVVVGPGAANNIKRWTTDGYAKLCDHLIERYRYSVVLVGDESDIPIAQIITGQMRNPCLNLCGLTTLVQMAEVLRRASLVIANDSAIMHMASYLDIPTVAIFGPTDPKKYGPWSSKQAVVRKDLFCSPCEKSGCAYKHECMEELKTEEVLEAVELILKDTGRQ